MAEAASSTSRSVLCRYFANGVCRFGRNCQYSHDRENSVADNVCRYYLAGNCAYGSRCRYEHVRTQEDRSQRQSATASSSSAPPPPPPSSSINDHPSGARAKQRQRQSAVASSSSLNCFAAEYKPQTESYKAVLSGLKDMNVTQSSKINVELCPYAEKGECPYQESCQYTHGDACELCGKLCLHPFDEEQRKQHKADCIKVLEDDMQLSFAISRSSEKECGICMEKVLEKANVKDRQFGILTGCNHIFCLVCIREWRARKEYNRKVVRSCPECRTHSDFIVPSNYWYEDDKEKEKFISDYKSRLSKMACKYFDKGKGKCPFGSACFYLHAYEDGTIAKNEEPPRAKPRRVRTAANTLRAIQQSLLWDFFEEREDREDRGAFSSVIDLDEDLIIQLLRSVGEVESDDSFSELSDDYYGEDHYLESDLTDDDDDDFNGMRFAFL